MMMGTIRHKISALLLMACLVSCQTTGNKDTIAKLHGMRVEIKEEKIEGGLEKAMEGYRRFLAETPDSSPLKPEALRRLADLKIEREYGSIDPVTDPAGKPKAASKITAPERTAVISGVTGTVVNRKAGESQADFEKRASSNDTLPAVASSEALSLPGTENLEKAGAREALVLYQKLLAEYPGYAKNDQVLYQMSRAFEELGQIDDAMKVMDKLVKAYPNSRYMDEVQFRRGEYFFTRRHYMDAEDAYRNVVRMGTKSHYYQLALYKLGWTFYKQEMYEEALDRYIALLDYKVSVGYDFAQTKDEQEKKRIDDTFRAVSLCFSNLHGQTTIADYFKNHGQKTYEDGVYQNLGEFYFDKRRYADAAAVYNAFVSTNPFHKVAPAFHMRVIEIQTAGAFPSLVIDAKKQFATNYGLKSAYWTHFDPASRPEVIGWLKMNITDLAKHYHSLYQNSDKTKDEKDEKTEKEKEAEKKANFEEALHWYQEYLASFPKNEETAGMNYLMADLLMENRSLKQAAAEYEKTAYEYPKHEKSSQAGYAAIYAYREYLKVAPPEDSLQVKKDIVRNSLKFADTYQEHEKAAIVLGAAADDLYNMKDYEGAVSAGKKLIGAFPKAEADVTRSAWLVVGHGNFELRNYAESEAAYTKVLAMMPEGDKGKEALLDNLAASIYKQGEEANTAKDYKKASEQFLRVGKLAPTSKIRANAEYDAAAALMELKDWKSSAIVLAGFRDLFPGHALQPEVTKKIAYVYKEDGKLAESAGEYERMEKESQDEEVRREALLTAAELYETAGIKEKSLSVYRRYVELFPHPVEPNLETRMKIAEALKKTDKDGYMAELKQIITIDSAAGNERTVRTRYLAGKSALVIAEDSFTQFTAVKLVEPFKTNLDRKKSLMKASTQQFNKLLDYEAGEVTAAAIYYLAEIYADFCKCLKESERPKDLSPVELEQYELDLEDQAYPFEEKAIATHRSNLELVARGVYNEWIDKSLQKLAVSVPARYDKPEEESEVLTSIDNYQYAVAEPEEPVNQANDTGSATGEDKKEVKPEGTGENDGPAETVDPKQATKPPEIKDEIKSRETVTSSSDKGAEALSAAEVKQQ